MVISIRLTTKGNQNRSDIPRTVRFCTDANKRVITDNCKKRGWIQVKNTDKWNVYFSATKRCKKLWARDSTFIMNNNQLISHFPNSYILTRKDFLPVCVNKYIRALERLLVECGESKAKAPKIIPTTYVLPQEYPKLIRECEKYPDTMWIMKPCNRANGRGIYLTNDVNSFKKWENKCNNYKLSREASDKAYVASKYITKPLLIHGRKFDLRLYVVVSSYQPLKAYLFKHGFCRFCSEKYNKGNLHSRYMHLTNVSIQKHRRTYNRNHGGKWSIQNLKLYLESTHGAPITTKLFSDIKELIVHSLKAVQAAISSDLHCFEMYGYDVIIDSYLKPWLIEVNSSPSICSTTRSDRILKMKLFDSILSLVIPPHGCPDITWNKCPTKEALQEFDLLIDEDQLQHSKLNLSSYADISKLSLSLRRELSSRRSLPKREMESASSLDHSHSHLHRARSAIPRIATSGLISTPIPTLLRTTKSHSISIASQLEAAPSYIMPIQTATQTAMAKTFACPNVDKNIILETRSLVNQKTNETSNSMTCVKVLNKTKSCPPATTSRKRSARRFTYGSTASRKSKTSNQKTSPSSKVNDQSNANVINKTRSARQPINNLTSGTSTIPFTPKPSLTQQKFKRLKKKKKRYVRAIKSCTDMSGKFLQVEVEAPSKSVPNSNIVINFDQSEEKMS